MTSACVRLSAARPEVKQLPLLPVADNGPGIPKDIQPQIYEVFFTTREGGTGLGLNIVSRIVEERRGKLTLDSEPGKGATFRIKLPATRAPQPNP